MVVYRLVERPSLYGHNKHWCFLSILFGTTNREGKMCKNLVEIWCKFGGNIPLHMSVILPRLGKIDGAVTNAFWSEICH